jgi:prolyl-tRNA synthetase
MSQKGIAPRHEDYNQWYLDVIAAAELAEHSPVKGCMIIKPTGYALWERVRDILDIEFKKTGVKNAYFPLFIPQSFLKREEEHVEGFAPEIAVVTHAGGKELEEPLVVRPTSETIIYETFKDWVQSYRDLPLLINQWANVVRWEMRTRLFLRTTEFLWQEGHTAHATEEDADERARQMLEVYTRFAEDIMAIPVIQGVKTESERFAGAKRTYCVEAMMQDGKALQFGTSHLLGQGFAEAFKVKYTDEQNQEQYVWLTSWGVSTRTIGALIMTHSDDRGLVLPPKMAPMQVVVLPLWFKDGQKDQVLGKAEELISQLEAQGIRVHKDVRDHLRPGEKFFEWEKKGVPVRIEIGPKDIAANQVVVARRDVEGKESLTIDGLAENIVEVLDRMQQGLFDRAKAYRDEASLESDSWEHFVSMIESGKFVYAHWDGTAETEKMIKEETGATIRCIPLASKEEDGVCIKTGKSSKKRVLFAKAY